MNTNKVKNIDKTSKDKLMKSKILLLPFMEKPLKIESKVLLMLPIHYSETRNKLLTINLRNYMKLLKSLETENSLWLTPIRIYIADKRSWNKKRINSLLNWTTLRKWVNKTQLSLRMLKLKLWSSIDPEYLDFNL